eukprot:TRINITY_DN29205_c0_g1_i1.p1 TRINITY_DN29205_c0_g1~~TRINITY_DN29205_c0_g1_i1.p1  ORF type:complete len:283 (+),score=70.67 TRINITY_DN29205_c0_g1_i1:82-930(+)
MVVIDRTEEFRHIIQQLAATGAVPGFTGLDESKGSQAQSEINVWSAQIGTEIHQASLKVQELRKMARAKGIFNDKTQEIQELTYNVKDEIKMLDQKIEALSAKAKGSGPSRSYQAHASNMVETLKTRLLEVTKDFKDALEDRTKTLEVQDKRRQMYSASSSGPSNPFAARQTPSGNAADLEGGVGQAQQVMHHSSRAEAVQNVQNTIGELAQMFQKMAVLVTSQEDMIKRIDSDVDDTLDNVQSAQDQLLKYFKNISSNRMLILKVFAILLFFTVFFVIFLA